MKSLTDLFQPSTQAFPTVDNDPVPASTTYSAQNHCLSVGCLPNDEYYKVHHPFIWEASLPIFPANDFPVPGEGGTNCENSHDS